MVLKHGKQWTERNIVSCQSNKWNEIHEDCYNLYLLASQLRLNGAEQQNDKWGHYCIYQVPTAADVKANMVFVNTCQAYTVHIDNVFYNYQSVLYACT